MAKKTKAETPKDDGLQRFVTWINESDDATQETRNLAEKSRDRTNGRRLKKPF